MKQGRTRTGSLLPSLLLAAGLLALQGCGGGGTGASGEPVPAAAPAPVETIPARGTEATLDVATWNLEWFGDPGRGPADDALQLENVARVMAALEVDLWSVQEVVDTGHFDELLSRLPGYRGFLADDPSVEGGAASYSDFDGNEQKVGLVYRASLVEVRSARVILADQDYAFAGRPPVEVLLAVRRGGEDEELVVILLHAKAGADGDDWDRRRRGAVALGAYLDRTWPDARVLVLGDFNDDVDRSITEPRESSYLNLVSDPEWIFLSAALSEARESSTVFYPDVIDHHLVSDELLADYLEGSVAIVRPDRWVRDYGESTSDHYPVMSRFRLGGDAPPPFN